MRWRKHFLKRLAQVKGSNVLIGKTMEKDLQAITEMKVGKSKVVS